ncbi:MAG TPA: Rpn family recombination-promoting nuclease/putative transposase [Archangium sp.]|nr:Rpn family recombination-promoting nuclease/putative transposase [Archangium sp.]
MLPVIIPLVMYHGADGAWTAPRRVEERERWRALVPRFEYLLDDLTSERDEALRARSGPPLARRVLRYGRTGELAQKSLSRPSSRAPHPTRAPASARPASRATTSTSVPGSSGLARCTWKPAR